MAEVLLNRAWGFVLLAVAFWGVACGWWPACVPFLVAVARLRFRGWRVWA